MRAVRPRAGRAQIDGPTACSVGSDIVAVDHGRHFLIVRPSKIAAIQSMLTELSALCHVAVTLILTEP